MNYQDEYAIGQAFDLAEEARYELEDQAESKLRKLTQMLPEPYRHDLIAIHQEHISYAMGLTRSARSWLHPLIGDQCIHEGNRLRYEPLTDRRGVLPPELSRGLFHFEEHLRGTVAPGTRIHYGAVIWQFLMSFHRRRHLSLIHPADLHRFRTVRQSQGITRQTINAEAATIRRFFEWTADNNEEVAINPAWQRPSHCRPKLPIDTEPQP